MSAGVSGVDEKSTIDSSERPKDGGLDMNDAGAQEAITDVVAIAGPAHVAGLELGVCDAAVLCALRRGVQCGVSVAVRLAPCASVEASTMGDVSVPKTSAHTTRNVQHEDMRSAVRVASPS